MQSVSKLKWEVRQPQQDDSVRFVEEGWQMAHLEGAAALESISIKHEAETRDVDAAVTHLQAQGGVLLRLRDVIEARLEELGFNMLQHFHEVAQGKLDLAWAIGLFTLNAGLAVLVLLAYGPAPLAIALALVVLASALPIEEFFEAHHNGRTIHEGVFLTLSIIGLTAQMFLGSVRGMFLTALSTTSTGPATEALEKGGAIVRYALGILAVVSEAIAGWKLYRAKTLLLSATARAVHERNRIHIQLAALCAAIQATQAGPEIRHRYRVIGARQCLAWSAGEKQRLAATHARRALKGALIALLIIAILAFLVSRLSATEPVARRDIVVVPDLTLSTSTQNFRANLQAVSSIVANVKPRDRIVVAGITDSFGDPALLFDRTVPSEIGYLGLKLRTKREEMVAAWNAASKNLTRQYKQSDLIGTFFLLSYIGGLSPSHMDVVVFSDLRQCTPDLNFEAVKEIPAGKIVNRLKEAKKIPNLQGAKVYLLGVDPLGKDQIYFRSLKDFWLAYFRETGADVKAFSIDRTVPDF